MKDQNEALQELSETVGDFIRYWGFRRIHGQLWTLIYLSKEPLSGAQLMRQLQVSKALVSPALFELEQYGLIESIEIDGRTKAYTADPDVFKVIRSILKKREKEMICQARLKFELLSRSMAQSSDTGIREDRKQALGEMISTAELALDFIINTADPEAFANWIVLKEGFEKGG